MIPVFEETKKAQSPSLCEKLITERLYVTTGGLEPSDGLVIIEIPRFNVVEEFVRGSVQGVHWIARLQSVQCRRDGWDVEYKISEVENDR